MIHVDVFFNLSILLGENLMIIFLVLVLFLMNTFHCVSGFLLPPESGEKVSLEVTVLLSQAVFLLVISDFLPPSADNFPILGK